MIDNEPELDAVCVCTYNRTHAECTIYALEHGIHVMLEKPMSVTTEEALEMVKAGDVMTEYDKLIDRQLERAVISCTAGFTKIFDGASKVLSV